MTLEGRSVYVFDIETRGQIQSVDFVQTMEITVVGLYSYQDSSYKTFTEEELPMLAHMLKSAELLVGFNNDHFDTPILNKYMPFDLTSLASIDIMRELQKEIKTRVSLNSVAGGTLGEYKSGSGKEAVKLWEEKRYEELKKYCLDDVMLTKKIFDYVLSQKNIRYTSKDGWLVFQVPMEWDINKMIESRSQKSQYSLW